MCLFTVRRLPPGRDLGAVPAQRQRLLHHLRGGHRGRAGRGAAGDWDFIFLSVFPREMPVSWHPPICFFLTWQDHFSSRLVTGGTGEVYARTGYLGFLRRTEAIGSDGGISMTHIAKPKIITAVHISKLKWWKSNFTGFLRTVRDTNSNYCFSLFTIAVGAAPVA